MHQEGWENYVTHGRLLVSFQKERFLLHSLAHPTNRFCCVCLTTVLRWGSPQLLETIYLCNPPTVIYALFQIFRVILPKRVLDKVDMLNPSDKAKDRQRLYKHITEDYLPQYYGGNNPKLPHEM